MAAVPSMLIVVAGWGRGMGAFVVTDAAFAGVRLLARRPLSALAWASIYALFFGAVVTLFGTVVVNLIGAVGKPGGTPTAAAVFSLVAGFLGIYLLFLVGLLVVGGVVTCAVIRAVLAPRDSAFAYLRLGARELWLILVNLCQFLLVFIVTLVLAIPLGIIVVLMGSPLGVESIAVRIVGQLVVNGVGYWIYLRLSMAAPMTFDERRFRLLESWELTRTHAWRLFLVGLLVVVMAVGLEIVVGLTGFAAGAAIWGHIPGLNDPKTFFARPPGQWAGSLAPLMALAAGLGMVFMAVVTPLAIAPWAYIYRQLKPEDEIASTFA